VTAEEAIKELRTWLGPFGTLAEYLDAEPDDKRALRVDFPEAGSTRIGLHVLWHINDVMKRVGS
jgi:hypothetical protein